MRSYSVDVRKAAGQATREEKAARVAEEALAREWRQQDEKIERIQARLDARIPEVLGRVGESLHSAIDQMLDRLPGDIRPRLEVGRLHTGTRNMSLTYTLKLPLGGIEDDKGTDLPLKLRLFAVHDGDPTGREQVKGMKGSFKIACGVTDVLKAHHEGELANEGLSFDPPFDVKILRADETVFEPVSKAVIGDAIKGYLVRLAGLRNDFGKAVSVGGIEEGFALDLKWRIPEPDKVETRVNPYNGYRLREAVLL